MLKNENIICISSIDWDFVWQGHQEIMSAFAENGNRVLFIENTGVRTPGIKDLSRIVKRIRNWFKGIKGIREEAKNLYIFSPLVLPFPHSRIATWINQRIISSILDKWTRAMEFSDPIIWIFLPTPLSINIAKSSINKLIIYYCIDNFSVSSSSAKKIRASERKLLKEADLIFATSGELYNYCSRYNDKVFSFPFAVNFRKFEKIRLKDSAIPEELKDVKHPLIGYVGGVHKWIDKDLIKEAAEKHPGHSFIFIGPVQTDLSLLRPFKNVYFLGKKDHEEIALFIKHFDVAIIPYLITDYTNNVYPTKLNEYLALGKPVVSTSLPEIQKFNRDYKDILYVAENNEKFSEYIDKAIVEDNQALKERRIDTAQQNNWGDRIEKMCGLIEEQVNRKRLSREKRWKENLIAFYRTARRKLWGIAITCIFMYFLLFKTSFIWFLAAPLKIAEMPQKADAIVVFGGGVGETGGPGKSTIERARYAVELYKHGYADKIIYSSGYTYNYNDAENMQLFSISMGIPVKDIVLEQRASSTYENVIFTREILDKNSWDSILLVSSPYNMRRAQLVFKKKARNTKVFYVPVQKSQFYYREYGVRAEQIEAIMHEYMGILYYWFKGYI